MEKERRVKILSVVALIIAVLGLTIAFASLSTTLKINGSSNVDTASWDIQFYKYSDYINEALQEMGIDMDTCISQYGSVACTGVLTNGTGKLIGEPEVLKTEINNLNLVISKPKDEVVYNVFIKNNGSIDGIVNSVMINGKQADAGDNMAQIICESNNAPVESCDWDNDGVVSENDVAKIVTNINLGYSLEDKPLYANNDPLTLSIYLKYEGKACGSSGCINNIEANELPKRNLNFNNLSIVANIIQRN